MDSIYFEACDTPTLSGLILLRRFISSKDFVPSCDPDLEVQMVGLKRAARGHYSLIRSGRWT